MLVIQLHIVPWEEFAMTIPAYEAFKQMSVVKSSQAREACWELFSSLSEPCHQGNILRQRFVEIILLQKVKYKHTCN